MLKGKLAFHQIYNFINPSCIGGINQPILQDSILNEVDQRERPSNPSYRIIYSQRKNN